MISLLQTLIGLATSDAWVKIKPYLRNLQFMRKVILSSFPGESVTGRWGGREESAYLVRTSVRKRSQVSKMSAPYPKQCQHCSVIYAPEVPMVQVKAKARLDRILPGPRTFPPSLAGFF